MKAIFTLKMLTDAGACSQQVELFRSTFGDSVNVTVAKARKVATLFDWRFGVQFLDDEGKVAYEAAIAPHLAEYERVSAAALAEYQRAIGPAWAEYERVRAVAWAEYQRVRGPALAEYERVRAAAWASAYIATCKRRAA